MWMSERMDKFGLLWILVQPLRYIHKYVCLRVYWRAKVDIFIYEVNGLPCERLEENGCISVNDDESPVPTLCVCMYVERIGIFNDKNIADTFKYMQMW